jgi:glycerol-3-phosphate cytidylyltransferase-like family protein
MSVGYLAGAFDLINVRDLDLIAQASSFCSTLIVGVFSDEFAERHYGRRPVVPLVERQALLSHVRGVGSVIVHDDTTSIPEPDVRCFSVAGDRPVVHGDNVWVLQSSRQTASVALRAALRSARGDGQSLRGDDVA